MIDVHNLSFTYPTASSAAIDGMTFSIGQGELFGFLGPSGAGKSTTQKILIGLLKNYSGTVTVGGKDLSAWGPAYYERIGVSFESPTHFLKLTALENLRYFRRLYARPTDSPEEVLSRVGLGDDGTMPVSQFSKGMKNRLSVARSLLHRPEILFLDEPTAGLDPVNSRVIRDLVRERRNAGTTVFLTTHDMAVASDLCDRVAFVVDGRIATIDSPRALKLQYGRAVVRVEYLGEQGQESRDFPLEGLGENDAFMDLLRTREVQTIHTLEASLDDVFIRVTGRQL